MNDKDISNKPGDSLFIELQQAVERLKQQANDNFRDHRNGFEDDYEVAYMRGYLFGQLASLEDCYNLFSEFLSRISQNDKKAINVLKQQINVSIKIIEDLTEKIRTDQPTKEYIELIQETISLIKNSSKNI